jgi:hypothetical protein
MEVSGQLYDSYTLLPGKEPPVPIEWEAGWATEPSGRRGEKKHDLPCWKSNTDHVASRYIDWATTYWKVHKNYVQANLPPYLFLKLYCRSSDGTNKVDHLNIDHGRERDWQLFLSLTHKRSHSVHGSPSPAPSSLEWTRTVNYQPSHCRSTKSNLFPNYWNIRFISIQQLSGLTSLCSVDVLTRKGENYYIRISYISG